MDQDQKLLKVKYLLDQMKDYRVDCLALRKAIDGIGGGRPPRLLHLLSDIPNPPPPPGLSPVPANYEWCAALLQTVAYNNHVAAIALNPPSSVAPVLQYDELYSLDLSNEWMELVEGLFKRIVRFYPIDGFPEEQPTRPIQESLKDLSSMALQR